MEEVKEAGLKLLESGVQQHATLVCKSCSRRLSTCIERIRASWMRSSNNPDLQTMGHRFVSETRRICRMCFRKRLIILDLSYLDPTVWKEFRFQHEMDYAVYLESKK